MRTLFDCAACLDACYPTIGRAGICNDVAKPTAAFADTLPATVQESQYFYRLDAGSAHLNVAPLTQSDIRRLLDLLNEELRDSTTEAELFLVGGAVMCLAYSARPSTQDVDAVFRPPTRVREAAARVGARAGLNPDWLNDGVKGFLGAQGDLVPFLELDHLRVMSAHPAYLLAMKCLALRIGAEFHDEDDVRYLLRHLDIRTYDRALTTIAKYYPIERFPQKTLYALAELLPKHA